MVETPVLFVTFVRPDYARQTWEGIKATKPKTLYFYSNKGRAEKEGEVERNNEIRSYINEIGIAICISSSVKSVSMCMTPFVVPLTGFLIMKREE